MLGVSVVIALTMQASAAEWRLYAMVAVVSSRCVAAERRDVSGRCAVLSGVFRRRGHRGGAAHLVRPERVRQCAVADLRLVGGRRDGCISQARLSLLTQ